VSEGSVLAELLSVFRVRRLWCWFRYGCSRFGELGFDRASLCNLVRKRETLHVPTLADALVLKRETLYVPILSDDLVLKTMVDRVTLYQFIYCLSVGAQSPLSFNPVTRVKQKYFLLYALRSANKTARFHLLEEAKWKVVNQIR